MSSNQKHTENIKKSIDDVIGANTVLKRKKKTEDDINREKFELIIRTLEEVEVRAMLMEQDFDLAFGTYDEKFYTIIDTLLGLYLGSDATDIVNFYLYNRIEPDGTVNQIMNESGEVVPLDTPADLWELVNFLKANPLKKKK
jgi:hypothetical protein